MIKCFVYFCYFKGKGIKQNKDTIQINNKDIRNKDKTYYIKIIKYLGILVQLILLQFIFIFECLAICILLLRKILTCDS